MFNPVAKIDILSSWHYESPSFNGYSVKIIYTHTGIPGQDPKHIYVTSSVNPANFMILSAVEVKILPVKFEENNKMQISELKNVCDVSPWHKKYLECLSKILHSAY